MQINHQCYRIQKGLACDVKHRAKQSSIRKTVYHSRLLKTSGCGLQLLHRSYYFYYSSKFLITGDKLNPLNQQAM